MGRRLWMASAALLMSRAVLCAGSPDTVSVRLLAFGDVNLGRSLGQKLLAGELGYPFARLRTVFRQADLVFLNLESVISDQGGVTEDKHSNFYFSAPPSAAYVLRDAGVSVVSVANNHAFDYGSTGVRETVRFLAGQRVACVGLNADAGELMAPVILERKGIRFGFAAYTQFSNRRRGASSWVALFDSVRVWKEVQALRDSADVVIVSYHGGREYASLPDSTSLAQMRMLVDAGADVVFGHHPHVPHGIDRYRGRWIFTSLGNLIFVQPQREWTQAGWGADLVWTRTDSLRLTSVRMHPVRVGFQPAIGPGTPPVRRLAERLRGQSRISFTIEKADSTIHVDPTVLRP